LTTATPWTTSVPLQTASLETGETDLAKSQVMPADAAFYQYPMSEMIQQLSCHSFRATTITDLLAQGVPLEDVQYLAGHADLRTTRLYDRRRKQMTRNIVERISV
jgi:site-specific recombinase XerD